MTATSESTEALGYVAPGFEKVAEVLATTAASSGELGVGVAATIEGEVVVDLSWGEGSTGKWTSETMACVYSCTKGMTAFVTQMLVDRGLLDVNALVSKYWPEFAVNGKEDTLVCHFLNHTAGVLTFDRYWEVTGLDGAGVADTERIIPLLAEAKPSWVPGSAAGYHAITYGWLIGELVRRVNGRTVGRFFADEIAGPLGLDAYIGLPAELHGRVADTVAPLPLPPEQQAVADAVFLKGMEEVRDGGQSLEALTVGSLFIHPDHPNVPDFLPAMMRLPRVRSAEVPAGNAIATAIALAKMYVPLANGGAVPGGPALVSPESIELFTTPTTTSDGTPTGFGLGYGLMPEGFGGPGIEGTVFGHAGAGGNHGLADPTRRLSYAYVKNRMLYDDMASLAPLRALYTCL